MKAPFILCIILFSMAIFSCKKSHISATQPQLSPAIAESYLTGGAWAFTYEPWQTRPAIFDSVGFFFTSQISANEYEDSIVAYYPGRLVQYAEGRFIVSSLSNTPDTLISVFTPYTAAFNQIDTFLVKSLTQKQMVLLLYHTNYPPGYTPLQDTVTRK